MTQGIQVSLPVEIVMVTGTVNDLPATWTFVGGGTWQTAAPRVSNDTYHIQITAVNSLGTANTFDFSLYYGLELITDRVQADLDRIQRLLSTPPELWSGADRAWYNLAESRGVYNYTDLNRVGYAIQFIAGRLREYGYSVQVTAREDWTETETMTSSDAEAYLGDVQTLRDILAVMDTTPEVPEDMDGLTYTEANHIEQILMDVDFLITQMTYGWIYSGDIYSGEVI